MIYNVKGRVINSNTEYFDCLTLEYLSVDVYGVNFGSLTTSLGSSVIDSDGTFDFSVNTEAKSIVAKVIYSESIEVQIPLAESQKFCRYDVIDILFEVDESEAGARVFAKILSRLTAASVPTTAEGIIALTPEQLKEIGCITCITENALRRFQTAYRLENDLTAFPNNMHPDDTAEYITSFLTEIETARQVFFALAKNGNESLASALTHTSVQFNELVLKADDDFEIDDIEDIATLGQQLVACRNAVLLNALNDESYFDAKLIYLSGTFDGGNDDYSIQAALLESALRRNGISSVEVDGTFTEAALELVTDIKTLSGHVQNYIPFLAIAVNEFEPAPDYFEMTLAGEGEWTTLIGSTYPAEFDTATDYAKKIYHSHADEYPSARVAYHLTGDPLGSDYVAVRTQLSNPAYKDFNIEKHAVRSYFAGLDPVIAEKVETVQRLVKLTDARETLSDVGVLLLKGYKSTRDIVEAGEATFLNDVGEDGEGSMEMTTAKQTYCYAKAIYDSIMALMLQYKKNEAHGAIVPKYLDDSNLEFPEDTLPTDLPDMETLFGSLSTCTCDHCQSVYSPAAYLTDLLNWMLIDVVPYPLPTLTHPGPPDPKLIIPSAFAELERLAPETGEPNRRPDIRYILLNCENTNTLVPYIDIVNEILSVNLLTHTSGFPPNTDELVDGRNPHIHDDLRDAYKTLQTTKTAAEILTEPENRFHDSEELLKGWHFPWALPYNAPYDETTSLLNAGERKYHELILDFTKPVDKYNTAAWATAYLNLNPEEYSMFITSHSSDPNFWGNFWGTTNNTTIGPVLKGANITLVQLTNLLETYYVSAGNLATIGIVQAVDVCDVEGYEFTREVAPPHDTKHTKTVSDRMMKFLRLGKKTGLSNWELDLAIKNMSSTGIDSDFMQKLAACTSFCKSFGVEFSELQVWFSTQPYFDLFNGSVYSDYFNNRFKNALLHPDVVEFFEDGLIHPYDVEDVTDPADFTNKEKQILSIVCKVSIPAIDAIVSYLNPGAVALDNTLLGKIDRYSSLMRALNIEASELKNTMELLDDPFQSTVVNIIKDAWDLSYKLEQVRKIEVSLTELKNIANGTGAYSLVNLDNAAKAVWEEVEKAYQQAIKANPQKEFSGSPLMPQGKDVDFFGDIIIAAIARPFKIDAEHVRSVIHNYDAAWLDDFMAAPAALRAWSTTNTVFGSTLSAAFAPVYRILNRIALLSELLGLDQQGIGAGISVEITAGMTLPNNPFYWMDDDFTALTPALLRDLIWVKNATLQAEFLNMSQTNYFIAAAEYHDATINAGTFSPITSLYYNLGADCPYKSLSLYEFTEIFTLATSISTSADMVSILQHFEVVFNDANVFDMKVADIWGWVWDPGTFTPVTVDADLAADVKRAIHNAYPTFSAWSDFIVPVKNELRDRLRNALVGYYIGFKGFEDENSLYTHFLLDTQMAPCMQTSRIVAAISSAQLLIHRALLGFEPGIDFIDEQDKREWEWRKNYRVWEANRKVFLYPENWIDPSLRTNKTFLFKEAEDLLQQDEINDENSEKALAGYLTGLNEVARLNIVGCFIENTKEGSVIDYDLTDAGYVPYGPDIHDERNDEILHVFGRTWNPPYTYYYRTFKESMWTAWEKLDIEINSDHLLPVIFNRKLYLFFPMFIDKMYMDNTVNPPFTKPYYEIQMCYTKLDFGKWSQKKVLNGKLIAANNIFLQHENSEIHLPIMTQTPGLNKNLNLPGVHHLGIYKVLTATNNYTYALASMKKEDFYFWADLRSNGDLEIKCRRALDPAYALSQFQTSFAYDRSFLISAANETVDLVLPDIPEPLNLPRMLARPFNTMPYAQQMKWDSNTPAKLRLSQVYTVPPFYYDTVLLDSNAHDYVLTYPHQFRHNTAYQPFFYADKKRCFFFMSTDGYRYKIFSNEHPYVLNMLQKLNAGGVDALYNPPSPDAMKRQELNSDHYFAAPIFPAPPLPEYYSPNGSAIDTAILPKDEFDFNPNGPYAIYNWEIFFHTTSLVARQLRLNNKFADAIHWLNYIFDPSDRDIALKDLRYWQIKPFMQNVSQGSISNMIRLLSVSNASQIPLNEATRMQIEAWRANPFDPHMIAGMRPRAYMLWTVMEYVTTLSEWGDYLFRQDTMESINEATNLYVIAQEILGRRPTEIRGPEPPEKSFDDVMNDLSGFSNVMVDIENLVPTLKYCNCDMATSGSVGGPSMGSDFICLNTPLSFTTRDLLFCIPGNPKLVEMWDNVEDKLFKIRHCMNIDGKIRSLALFAPPIDPALLVQAVAGGLSIESALKDLAAPLPHYRFSYLLQKANDFCNEVKALGSQLLTLMEKKDAEELSLFRQVHEQNILKAARSLKEMAIAEAKQNRATLESSKTLIQIRLDDYSNREYKNSRESNAMRQTKLAEDMLISEQGARGIAGLMALIPDIFAGAPTAMGATVFGGGKLNKVIEAGGIVLNVLSTMNRNKSAMSLTISGYDRRKEDWDLQIKSAKEELEQIERQLFGADLRIKVAEKDLANHDLQVEQSKEMYDWLKNKYTNGKLYSWLQGQVKTVYRQAFDLAYNMAKKAQVCMDYELGESSSSVIQYGQWDSSRSGFLAGERLALQLKQLETEYINNNKRDYELSKNISLALLDPYALELLKATGECIIVLPEVLFDLDHPNHYCRRIKSMSLSIPCIAGPNTNISANLSLENHVIRDSSSAAAYAAKEPNLSGFSESIATSSSQNDSGLFELNFKDERYIPFEGKGAVSEWKLKLSSFRTFDFTTISDVVMHLKYTAKEAGETFATAVKTAATASLNALAPSLGEGFFYAFSLKHDMPNQWHAFQETGTTQVKVEKSRLPYLVQAFTLTVTNVTYVIERKTATATTPLKINIDSVLTTISPKITDSIKTYKATVTPSNTALGTLYTLDDDSTLPKTDIDDIIVIAKISVS